METLKEKGGVIQIPYRSMDIIEDRISAEYRVDRQRKGRIKDIYSLLSSLLTKL